MRLTPNQRRMGIFKESRNIRMIKGRVFWRVNKMMISLKSLRRRNKQKSHNKKRRPIAIISNLNKI